MGPAKLRRKLQQHSNGWLYLSLLGAAIIMLPILAIIISVFSEPNENWAHIKQFLLRDYVLGSIWLVLLSGVGTAVLGAALAWLVAAYDFPFKSFFRWALMLPLAIPPYIAAYTYSAMTSYTGVVQKTLRHWGLTIDPVWFTVMSFRGAVFVFVLFLYPYVYMITRAYLERQSGSYIENGRLLGRSSFSIFLHVALPLSRPAIIGGSILVAFEVLSDYGVVNYFGVPTLTTAIFRTWFGMYDIDSATRLAAWFIIGILSIIVLERLLRRHRRFSATTSRANRLVPQRLKGARAWMASLFCGVVLSIAFIIPVGQLFVWAGWTYSTVIVTADFWQLTLNTLSVALIATAFIIILSLIVANTSRRMNHIAGIALSKLITAGYSIPGPIIAIGVLSLFIWLDERLSLVYVHWLDKPAGALVLSMSLVMLVVAYVIRFTATGYNAIEAGFEKVGPTYSEASRMLGAGMTRTFFKIDLPLIRGAVWGGIILTLVEVVKELPLALLLRPFNFETLATKAYQYASDERIYSAAVPSLFIIGVSMVSIILINYLGRREGA